MNKKGETDLINGFIYVLGFLFLLMFSGISLGVLGYSMGELETAIGLIDFEVPTNSSGNFTSFQDFADVILYPILGLRESLPYISYFFIFAMVLLFVLMGYISQQRPILFVPYVLILIVYSVVCITISNAYEQLLTNPFILNMMIEYYIFNKIMLYLPQFVFFSGLVIGGIFAMNSVKRRQLSSEYETLNY